MKELAIVLTIWIFPSLISICCFLIVRFIIGLKQVRFYQLTGGTLASFVIGYNYISASFAIANTIRKIRVITNKQKDEIAYYIAETIE